MFVAKVQTRYEGPAAQAEHFSNLHVTRYFQTNFMSITHTQQMLH